MELVPCACTLYNIKVSQPLNTSFLKWTILASLGYVTNGVDHFSFFWKRSHYEKELGNPDLASTKNLTN